MKQRFSVSGQTTCVVTNIEGKSIKFIDTPGFCDSRLSVPENFNELSHAIMLSRSGVHAFAMVLDVTSRFSKANVTALQDFFELGEITPYTFVIFTKAKQLASRESEQKTVILEMLSDVNVPNSLCEFMQKINNRFILLESINYMGEDYLVKKLAELSQMLVKITTETNGIFTCYLMNHAKQLYENETQGNPDELSRHNAAVHHLLANIQEVKQKRLDLKRKNSTYRLSNLRTASFCLAVAFLGATIGYTYMSPLLGTCSGVFLGGILGEFIHTCIEKQKMKLPLQARSIPFCLILASIGAIVGSMRVSFKVGALVGVGLGLVGKVIYDYTEKQLT